MCHVKVDVIAGDANAAPFKYYKNQEYQDLYDSSVAVMLREMQREVNTGHTFEIKLHIVCSTNNHPAQLHAANETDCCFMAIPSWEKRAGPRTMRKFWSNITTGQSENLREQTDDKKEKQTEDNSRERRVERKPAEGGGPAGLPRGRRRFHGGTSRSWHPPIWESPGAPKQGPLVTTNRYVLAPSILMTIREEPFKNYRLKTSEMWKAKEDKVEDAKKQKIKRSDDEWNYADWQP